MGVLATVLVPLLWLAGCGVFHGRTPGPKYPGGWTVYLPAERDARWSGARCNDGTPSSVAVRRSPTGSRDWVIQVHGGRYCDDRFVQCSERPTRFTTGLAGPRGRVPDGGQWPFEGRGLFDFDPRVNPDFHDANQVQLWYCSSDHWLGDSVERRPTSGSPEGWYFSGRHAFRAGLEVLEQAGLDQADPQTRVLIVGQSAGGFGLVSNLDAIQQIWPEMIEGGRLKAVVDGAWLAPVPEEKFVPLDRWGHLLAPCVADKKRTGENPLHCEYGHAWLPYWEEAGIDVLVAQSGLDSSLLRILEVPKGEARARFREEQRADLEKLDRVVSGGVPYHIIAFDERLPNTVLGREFIDVLGRFWRGGEPEKVFYGYDAPP